MTIAHAREESSDIRNPQSDNFVPQLKGQSLVKFKITILPREEAWLASEAAAFRATIQDATELSFWADAAFTNKWASRATIGGIGVVYRPWKCNSVDQDILWQQTFSVACCVNSAQYAEALAIHEALSIAHEEIQRILRYENRKRLGLPLIVNIFSDCQDALTALGRMKESCKEYGATSLNTRTERKLIHEIGQLGGQIHLRWVPGHSHDPGNNLADAAARMSLLPSMFKVEDLIPGEISRLFIRNIRADEQPPKESASKKRRIELCS